MAKLDRSKGLFAQMSRVLEEIAEDPVEAAIEQDVRASSWAALFLSLAEIEPDPDQPRKSFEDVDEGSNSLDALQGSILTHGVLQPISVRRLESGKYQIIAGERRWRAATAAHASGQSCRRKGYDLSRIPAVILAPESDPDRLEMQLVENLARADMSPLDTAQAVARLMDSLDPKPSLSELGKRIGRSKAWVHQMMALASPESQEVADALGVPLGSIGQTDLSRMRGWLNDEDKRVVLDAIRASLQAGESLSRVLVDKEEARYERNRNTVTTEEGKTMEQENRQPIRAFDENGEEVDPSTIELEPTIDDDEDPDAGEMEHENRNDTAVPAARGGTEEIGEAEVAAIPDLPQSDSTITVALSRSLVERVFRLVGESFPENPHPERIVQALEILLVMYK